MRKFISIMLIPLISLAGDFIFLTNGVSTLPGAGELVTERELSSLVDGKYLSTTGGVIFSKGGLTGSITNRLFIGGMGFEKWTEDDGISFDWAFYGGVFYIGRYKEQWRIPFTDESRFVTNAIHILATRDWVTNSVSGVLGSSKVYTDSSIVSLSNSVNSRLSGFSSSFQDSLLYSVGNTNFFWRWNDSNGTYTVTGVLK